jgi:anti-anti-sigma factor
MVLIRARDAGDVRIIYLQGRLDSLTAEGADTEIGALLEAGISRALINLGELEFISSVGLRVLVHLTKALRARHGQLKLCSATVPVGKVLEISGIASLIELHDQEQSALASFEGDLPHQ